MSPPPPATVCADHHPDQLRGHLAVRLPSWLVVFPDRIHDFSDCPLHKLLYSGKSHSSVAVEIWGPCSHRPSFVPLMGSPCLGGAGVGVTANVGGGTEVCPGLRSSRSSMREARGPCGKAELSGRPRTASLVATADSAIGESQSHVPQPHCLKLWGLIKCLKRFPSQTPAINRTQPFVLVFLHFLSPLLRFGGAGRSQVPDVMQVFGPGRVCLGQITYRGA